MVTRLGVRIAILVHHLDGDKGIGVFRLVIIPVVHFQVTVFLAEKVVDIRFGILVVVTHGKSILAWGLLQAGHLRLLSVFYGIHLPL